MTDITKTFEITTSAVNMAKLERFLALLHWNSRFGHSGTFGLNWDGDGQDKLTVNPEPQFAKEVNLIGGVGGEIEIALPGSYTCYGMREMKSRWEVKQMPVSITVPTLLKNDQIIKQSKT